MRRVVCVAVAALAVSACSDRGRSNPPPPPPPEDAGPTADAYVPQDTRPRPVDAGPAEDVLIYAHSRDTLFSFSAFTLTVEEIGPFRLAGGSPAPFMLDLAVDRDGEIFTADDQSLYRVDPDTAVVTPIGDFGLGEERLFALSFLAPGELRAEEVLVGATNAGAYYEVDERNASTDYLGTYPDGWLSSGDIVSVEGLGTFATVRRDDFPSDVLVQILFSGDGSSVAVTKGPIRQGTRDFTQLFGLGYWGAKVYGFSNAGELIEIDRDSGAATLVSEDTGAPQFWGAGVTTQVPFLI